jgi:hypothetical protein
MKCTEISRIFCSEFFCRIKTAAASCSLFCCLVLIFILPKTAGAQESLFVTYTHHMEETGSLEISTKAVSGFPNGAHTFLGNALEFEYGTKAWWTSEFYLDTQTTVGESSVFTGWRVENRFRTMMKEHWINPVLYVEFEDINGADKSLLEVVGHDGRSDFLERNNRSERKREIETRLILSSNFKGWNLSENLISEKNLSGEEWEFGYALGISRPLSLLATPNPCGLCRENFSLGAELYGGLGTRHSFGLPDTSHYFAPVLSFKTFRGPTFMVSPSIGLNDNSHQVLLRFGVAYEIGQVFSRFSRR